MVMTPFRICFSEDMLLRIKKNKQISDNCQYFAGIFSLNVSMVSAQFLSIRNRAVGGYVSITLTSFI